MLINVHQWSIQSKIFLEAKPPELNAIYNMIVWELMSNFQQNVLYCFKVEKHVTRYNHSDLWILTLLIS